MRDLLDILQYPERDHSAAQHRYRSRVDEFDWNNEISNSIVAAYFGFYEHAGILAQARFSAAVPGVG